VRAGIGDARWFELPLGAVTAADRLREIVLAAEAMVDGDDAPAREVLVADMGTLCDAANERR
jgi:hypothetical protein